MACQHVDQRFRHALESGRRLIAIREAVPPNGGTNTTQGRRLIAEHSPYVRSAVRMSRKSSEHAARVGGPARQVCPRAALGRWRESGEGRRMDPARRLRRSRRSAGTHLSAVMWRSRALPFRRSLGPMWSEAPLAGVGTGVLPRGETHVARHPPDRRTRDGAARIGRGVHRIRRATSMTLPTFLGIGVPRAGTSWLNTLLAGHPDVYVPAIRDEIRFFDEHYDRGFEWYESLFPSREEADGYRAIGEVSPQYLECEECTERISAAIPQSQLIVILRHPVTRSYSQYGFFLQRRNYRGSFEDFLAFNPRSIERSYSHHLKRYLNLFDRSRVLALVFEDVFRDVAQAKATIADFLDIDVARFPDSAGGGKVNASGVPRFRALSGFVAKTGNRLRRWHMEPIVDLFMRSPVHRLLGKGELLPPLDEDLKRRLSERFQGEFDQLERLMRIDLSSWREIGPPNPGVVDASRHHPRGGLASVVRDASRVRRSP